MKANYHTHTVFCDGKNTPEEIILAAIEKGFSSIGFSGHGYTAFDLRYCMKDFEGYTAEITRLKKKYRHKIEVYLGAEEDAFAPVERRRLDYIIGSSHYFHIGNRYYPIDSNYDYFQKCLEAFEYDVIQLSETYYRSFCEYILRRKPDIIGHFDVITKFDEMTSSLFLHNDRYNKIAEKYVLEAVKSECAFEVNTGAIARGLRTTAYPSENLLFILKKENARLILGSDSHSIETLDYGFEDSRKYLRSIGFRQLYTMFGGELVPYDI